MFIRGAAVAAIAAAAASITTSQLTAAPAGAPDLLSGYRWKARLLVVVAADPNDPRVEAQRRMFMDARQESRDRDLILVERTGETPDADALRGRFGVKPDDFRAVLVGKDGGDKLSSPEPISTDRLFGAIDAMPMRREEAGRQAER